MTFSYFLEWYFFFSCKFAFFFQIQGNSPHMNDAASYKGYTYSMCKHNYSVCTKAWLTWSQKFRGKCQGAPPPWESRTLSPVPNLFQYFGILICQARCEGDKCYYWIAAVTRIINYLGIIQFTCSCYQLGATWQSHHRTFVPLNRNYITIKSK